MTRKGSFFRAAGTVFAVPLFSALLAIYITAAGGSKAQANLLVLSGEILLAVLFTAALLYKNKIEGYKRIVYISFFIIPVLYAAATLKINYTGDALTFAATVLWSAIALYAVFHIIKDNPVDRLPYWGLILIGASAVLTLSSGAYAAIAAALLLKASGYSVLFAYIYSGTLLKMKTRLEEAEKKLSDINWEINKEVKKRTKEIEITNERLLNKSRIDGLTSILNQKAILDEVGKRTESSRVAKFAVLMFDIDKFKIINDTLGHITGDNCIRKLANIARGCIRDVDVIGRYGGDEFLIILHNASLPQAKLISERLCSKVSEVTDPQFTISIGVACYPDDGGTTEELISFADKGVYVSKNKQGNSISYKDII